MCGASSRLVELYSSYVCDFVLFCSVALLSVCFLPARYTIDESGIGYVPVFSFWQLIPCDASCLSWLALLVWLSSLRGRFRRMFVCPTLIICGCHLCVFYYFNCIFYCSFLVFSCESLPGHDVLCRLFSRPLTSVCFRSFCCFFSAAVLPVCFGLAPCIL